MNRFSFPFLILSIFTCIVMLPSPAPCEGLYMNLPSWFAPVDTAGTRFLTSDSWVQMENSEAMVLSIEVPFNIDRRTAFRLGVTYPVIHLDSSFRHGFADGSISATFKMRGDSVSTGGLFLRGDLRIPLGSEALYPFSFRSEENGIYPDIGGGLEYRYESVFFNLRSSASYFMAGQKETGGNRIHTDFFLGALMLEISIGDRTSFRGTVFAIDFSGRGYRECYLFGLSRRISRQIDLSASVAIDSGTDEERLFDSLLSLAIGYRFPYSAPVREGD